MSTLFGRYTEIIWLISFLIHAIGAVPSVIVAPKDHEENHYVVAMMNPISGYELNYHPDHHKPELHKRALEVQHRSHWQLVGQLGELNGHYIFKRSRASADTQPDITDEIYRDIKSIGHVKWIIPQQMKTRIKKRGPVPPIQDRLDIDDPGFKYQWHLINLKYPKSDINVSGVWETGVTGKGVVSAVIDDGVDANHEDLANNFFLEGSFDFNKNQKLPMPVNDDDFHGTRCAGEIAAVRNSYCGIGVAYESKVSGIRILGGPITDVEEALALNYEYHKNHIYSCSWGPEDDGQHVEGPNKIVQNAIYNGITKGRNGLGSIFVFATGNGGYFGDNCNYDGYTNSPYTITVGAIDIEHNHPPYSEKCSAHFATTYSSGSGLQIYTTNPRPDNCTFSHGGTSAAAPIAVGILALALSARPDLSWRDLQHLTVRAAVPIKPKEKDWQKTFAGRFYSHKYGYGKLDAWKIVEEAKKWKNVGPQTKFNSKVHVEDLDIPNNGKALSSVIEISKEDIQSANISRLEHVQAVVNISHPVRGFLDIWLISPNNISSHIGPSREADKSTEGFKNWTFMSVKHWEEDPAGQWNLLVIDRGRHRNLGKLHHWQLILNGESTIPRKNTHSTTPNTDVRYPEDTANTSGGSLLTTMKRIVIGVVFIGVAIGCAFLVKIGYKKVFPNPVMSEEYGMLDPIELDSTFVLDDEETDEEGEYLFHPNFHRSKLMLQHDADDISEDNQNLIAKETSGNNSNIISSSDDGDYDNK